MESRSRDLHSAKDDTDMQCRLIALLLLLPLSVRADEAPKPNTLTPKEIADGWILLFDGKTTFGWSSPNDSKWTIIDGILAPQKDNRGGQVTTTAFNEFDLYLEFQQTKTNSFIIDP